MKNYKLSTIRFIALIVVLMCHMFEQLGSDYERAELVTLGNFCSVGVQMFLLLSGYLYGLRDELFEKRNRFEFFITSCKKILYEYYFVAIIILIVTYFNSPQIIGYQEIRGLVTFSSFFWGTWHMWYISYILLCYFITPFLYDYIKYIQKKDKNLFIYLIFCLLFIIFICRSVCWYYTPAWIGCYVIGFFLPHLKKKIRKKTILCVALNLIVVACYIAKYRLRYSILPNIDPNSFLYVMISYYIDYTRVLCGLVIFIDIYIISGFISNIFPNSLYNASKKILNFFDEYSFDIYLIHMIFVKGVLSTTRVSSIIPLNIIIFIVISIISSVVIKYLSKKMRKCLSWRFFKKKTINRYIQEQSEE